MFIRREWYRQRAERTEVPLRPLVTQAVQPFVLQFGRALPACLLMLLAVGPLAVDAAVLDEETGGAVLELGTDIVAALAPAVSADFVTITMLLVVLRFGRTFLAGPLNLVAVGSPGDMPRRGDTPGSHPARRHLRRRGGTS